MSERDSLERELAELKAKNESATSWGAAVGARSERIKEIEGILKRGTLDVAQGAVTEARDLAFDNDPVVIELREIERIVSDSQVSNEAIGMRLRNTLAATNALSILGSLKDRIDRKSMVSQNAEFSQLADNLDVALNDYLLAEHGQERVYKGAKLTDILWDNKAGIIAALRRAASLPEGERKTAPWVCCYCDADLSCAACGHEQPDDSAHYAAIEAQAKQSRDARDYVLSAIASYDRDPPDNDFQRGHLAALELIRDEAFTPSSVASTDRGSAA